jgi:superfamily II DNA or RNA helicase
MQNKFIFSGRVKEQPPKTSYPDGVQMDTWAPYEVDESDKMDVDDDDDNSDHEIKSYFQQLQPVVLQKLTNGKCKLHENQKRCLLKLHEHQKSYKTSLIVLPTGTGKSIIAALSPFVLGVKSVLFITPSKQITKQMHNVFTSRILSNLRIIADVRSMDTAFVITKGEQLEDSLASKRLMIVNAQKFGTSAGVDMGDIPNDIDLVVIDEAHHYPAPTWKNIVLHFCNSRTVFLTATPIRANNDYILPKDFVAYNEMSLNDAIDKGIIRKLEFRSVGKDDTCYHEIDDDMDERAQLLGDEMIKLLNDHDKLDGQVKHKGMILAHRVCDANRAMLVLNKIYGDNTAVVYAGNVPETVLKDYEAGKYRILIICGKLLEGYDNPTVSVVGIHRNIHIRSRILFSQLVGCCVRKASPTDPVTAYVVAHTKWKQYDNYKQLDTLASTDPEDPDVEDD